jgi:hypothetical protein
VSGKGIGPPANYSETERRGGKRIYLGQVQKDETIKRLTDWIRATQQRFELRVPGSF